MPHEPDIRVLLATESRRYIGHYHVCPTSGHLNEPRRRTGHIKLDVGNWTYDELRFWLCSKMNRMLIMKVHMEPNVHKSCTYFLL